MRRPPALLVVGLAICLMGCVERHLTVRSDPADVTVILNGRRLTHSTPVTVEFTHHGVMRVEGEKIGYGRTVQAVETNAPWYDAFPFDLFAELWPGTLLSKTDVMLRLRKLTVDGVGGDDLDRLLEHAEKERERLTSDD